MAGKQDEESGSETGAGLSEFPMLEKVVANLAISLDELQMTIAAIKPSKSKITRQNHATCMANSCSPRFETQLGRAGNVLWRNGIVANLGAERMPLLLLLRNSVAIREEGELSEEILRTWEMYS